MDGLPYFLTHGAPRAQSSAINFALKFKGLTDYHGSIIGVLQSSFEPEINLLRGMETHV